jgi:phosphoglycolate phosphatase
VIRALLFDLDGTLIDSVADIGNAMNHVLGQHDLPTHPLEVYRAKVGEGAGQLVWDVLPAESSSELHASVLAAYKERYLSHLVVETRLYPGMPEALDALVSREVKLAVVTNKPQSATENIASALLARWPFAAIEGQQAGIPHKTDKTLALRAARTLGVQPSECLFVGDTRVDVATARAAGMTSVGCAWGFRGAAELREHGANHIIDAPIELLNLLTATCAKG